MCTIQSLILKLHIKRGLCCKKTPQHIYDYHIVSVLRLLQHAQFILIFFFRNNVWALCPNGYYLNGIRISAEKYLHQIEEAKCCRPNNHPDAYADCYDEDVGISFDRKGWSQCNRAGYYMAGFWRGGCDYIYCIEKFRCCRMKNGNYFLVIPTSL